MKSELRNTITVMKNTLEGVNGGLDNIEKWISDLEDRIWKSPKQNNKKKKIFKKNSLRDLRDNIKYRSPKRKRQTQRGRKLI